MADKTKVLLDLLMCLGRCSGTVELQRMYSNSIFYFVVRSLFSIG